MAIRPVRETKLIFQYEVLWNFAYMEYLNYNFCKKVPIYLCQQHNHITKATCFLKCYEQMLPDIVEKYMLGCETSHKGCFIQKCFQVTASHASTCRFVKTLSVTRYNHANFILLSVLGRNSHFQKHDFIIHKHKNTSGDNIYALKCAVPSESDKTRNQVKSMCFGDSYLSNDFWSITCFLK